MPLSREITKPNGDQSAPVFSWKRSLRDSSTSPTFGRCRSPSPGANMTDAGSSLRSYGKRNKLKTSTGNLAASLNVNGTGKSLNKSVELSGIEQEYIKNLQQQVYFLELETNYLREQSRKATEMHPVMTAEAERMLGKLRALQTENDGLRLEISRKEGHIDVQSKEKARLLDRLRGEEESHARDKSLLTDEIVVLRKDKALLERDLSTRSHHSSQLEKDNSQQHMAIRNMEQKLTLLKDQYDQACGKLKLTQDALDEKRAELLRSDNKLRDVEERYYSSTVAVQEKVSREYRDEIADLRRALKESEYAADQDRHLRTKVSEDSSMLVKENSLLTQQVHDLQSHLLRERGMRETSETRRSGEIGELLTLRDQIKQHQMELDGIREQLRLEQERSAHYLEKISRQEELGGKNSMNLASAQTRLSDLESMHRNTDGENSQLRRDKMLLVDHVTELQKQLETKESDNLRLLSRIATMEKRLSDVERQKMLETSLQSQKWGELENLAESMKSLSHNMSRSAVLDN